MFTTLNPSQMDKLANLVVAKINGTVSAPAVTEAAPKATRSSRKRAIAKVAAPAVAEPSTLTLKFDVERTTPKNTVFVENGGFNRLYIAKNSALGRKASLTITVS